MSSEKLMYAKAAPSVSEARYYPSEASADLYEMREPTALNEAIVGFAGLFRAGPKFLASASDWNFDVNFGRLRKVLADSDLNFYGLHLPEEEGEVAQTAKAFAAAIVRAGFHFCLADGAGAYAAAPLPDLAHDLSCDARFAVMVNGIRLGFLVLAHPDAAFASEGIASLKAEGAEYVFALLAGGLAGDEAVVQAICEAGAGMVIGVGPGNLQSCSTIVCADGRSVAVVPSLGTAFPAVTNRDAASAFLRVTVFRHADGCLDVTSDYVPFLRFADFKGVRDVILPTLQYYNGNAKIGPRTRKAERGVAEALGAVVARCPRERRIYNRNGFYPQISLRDICEACGKDVSGYDGDVDLDAKVPAVIIRKVDLVEGCVPVMAEMHWESTEIRIEDVLACHAPAVICKPGRDTKGVFAIEVEDPSAFFIELCALVKAKYDPFTVAITGTVGKSTTTDLIKCCMKRAHETLDARGNYNHYRSLGICVQKLKPTHTAYVQEVHGGTPGHASKCSHILKPDAVVITNIGEAHLSECGSVEGVLKSKLGLIDELAEGGALFVDIDNEYLRGIDVPVKVVTYGIESADADYRAVNIVDHGDRVEFQIVCADGVYDALIHTPGIHNAANATAAFAVGRFNGIDPDQLVCAISRYRTEGIRQNIFRKDGYAIILDSFSATPYSMGTSMESFSKLATGEGGRHVAVIGDVAHLGSKRSRYWHRQFADKAHELGIDILFTFGKETARTAERARELGMEVYEYREEEREALERKICEIIRPGDVLLFKASQPVCIEQCALDIFGVGKGSSGLAAQPSPSQKAKPKQQVAGAAAKKAPAAKPSFARRVKRKLKRLFG